MTKKNRTNISKSPDKPKPAEGNAKSQFTETKIIKTSERTKSLGGNTKTPWMKNRKIDIHCKDSDSLLISKSFSDTFSPLGTLALFQIDDWPLEKELLGRDGN